MSARDAESGSSSYRGGSGRAGGLGNGGIGGGMGGGGNWGGGMGGGAGRNGGIGNQTGLTTGNRMYGGVAFGRPGGPAMNPGAWGVRPSPPIGQGPLSGVKPPKGARPIPASTIPNERILAVEDVLPAAPVPNVFNQNYLNSISNFTQMMRDRYGWGANNPNVTPGPGPMPAPAPAPAAPASPPKYQDQVPQDPNFPGNTYNGWGTGGVGVVDPNRGWGGWNSPWN